MGKDLTIGEKLAVVKGIQRRSIRSKIKHCKGITKGKVCEICGISEPLSACHIVPTRYLVDIENLDKKYLDQDGVNIVILCKNHHFLYDHFRLDILDYLRLYPKIDGMLRELAYKIIPRLGYELRKNGRVIKEGWDHKRMEELINYIRRFKVYV